MNAVGNTSEDASLPPSFDPDEMFDVCNVENEVIGLERRAEVHAKGLYHRSVQVVVLNPQGEMLLQRRSPNKDVAPGCWDLSSSEHLRPSEDYGAAAARGLHEELGLDQAAAAARLTRVLPVSAV
jgi:isopentenyldiphosphate isomerase